MQHEAAAIMIAASIASTNVTLSTMATLFHVEVVVVSKASLVTRIPSVSISVASVKH